MGVKGSWRRDSQVPEEQVQSNWDLIFGKKEKQDESKEQVESRSKEQGNE